MGVGIMVRVRSIPLILTQLSTSQKDGDTNKDGGA